MWRNLSTWQILNLFCCHLHYLFVKSILRFCVEKDLTKNCVCANRITISTISQNAKFAQFSISCFIWIHPDHLAWDCVLVIWGYSGNFLFEFLVFGISYFVFVFVFVFVTSWSSCLGVRLGYSGVFQPDPATLMETWREFQICQDQPIFKIYHVYFCDIQDIFCVCTSRICHSCIVGFDTVNTNWPWGMNLLIHPKGWINDERMSLLHQNSGVIVKEIFLGLQEIFGVWAGNLPGFRDGLTNTFLVFSGARIK